MTTNLKFFNSFLLTLTICLAANTWAVEINATYPSLTVEQQASVEYCISELESELNSNTGNDWSVNLDISFTDLGATTKALSPGVEYVLSQPNKTGEQTTLGVASNFQYDISGRPTGATIEFNNNESISWHFDHQTDVTTGTTDFMSVCFHEVVHAVGFTVACDRFDAFITGEAGSTRVYNSRGTPTATLVPADSGTHLDPSEHPGDLMVPAIGTGIRRTPSTIDIDILNHNVWRYSIQALGMEQFPDPVDAGQDFRISATISYADGTPFDGGFTETIVNGAITTTVFTGASFTTDYATAPPQSQHITVRVFGSDGCCEENFEWALAVNQNNGLDIKHPLPNDRWAVGSLQEVRWEFANAACGVDIELSRNGGVTWEYLGSTPSGTQRTEIVVAGPATTNVYIRVTCQGDPSITDTVGPLEIYDLPASLTYTHTINGSVSNDDVDQGMAFSPDGAYLAFRLSGYAGRVTIYDARTYQHIATPFPSLGCFAVAFSPNSRYIASVSNERLYVWDLQSGSWHTNGTSTNGREGESIAWINNTKLAIIGDTGGGEDGGAIYNIDGTLVASFNGENLQSLASDGTNIYGGNSDGVIYKWGQIGGASQSTNNLCMNDIFSLAVSPDNLRVVAVGRGLSACNRPNVTIVNASNLTLIRQGWVVDNTADITDVAYDPNDNSRLVVSEQEGQVVIINEQLQVVQSVDNTGTGASVNDAAWSPGGVIAINAVNGIRLYPVNDITDPLVSLDPPSLTSLTGCASDPTGILAASYQIDDGDWLAISITPDACFEIPFSDLEPGEHSIGVSATDLAGNIGYESASVDIPCDLLSPTLLIGPADGSTGLSIPVTIQWAAIPDAASYQVELGVCGEPAIILNSTTTLAVLTNIHEDQNFCWRVQGITQCGDPGPWSAEWTFATETASGLPDIPTDFALYRCSPNPFNPSTTLKYSLPVASNVRLSIYNVRGQHIQTLVQNEHKPAGIHSVVWRGIDKKGAVAPSGVYFYKIEAGAFHETKRMTLLK